MSLATILTVYSGYYRTKHWILALLVILLGYLAYFLLPVSRGYYFYGGTGSDNLVHIGLIHDVLEYNKLTDLTYPAPHIIGTIIMDFIGLEQQTTISILSYFFMIVFILATFLTSRRLGGLKIGIFTLSASYPILFNINRFQLSPWLFGLTILLLCFLAIIMYVQIGNKNGIPLIITLLAISIVIYHPISTAYLFMIIFFYSVIISFGKDSLRPHYISMSLIFVAVFSWHLINQTVAGSIRSTVQSLILGQSGSGSELATGASESTDLTVSQLIFHFALPNWGVVFTFLILSSLVLLVIIYRYITYSPKSYEIFIGTQFIIGIFVGLLFLIFDIHATTPMRAIQYGLIFTVYCIGLGIYYASSTSQKGWNSYKRPIIMLMICLILITCLVGALSTTYNDNNHMAKSDSSGYGWNLEYKNTEKTTYADFGRDVYPFYHFGYSTAREKVFSEQRGEYTTEDGLAPHFGYHEFETPNERFEEAYILVRTEDLVWYEREPDWRKEELDYITKEDNYRIANEVSTNHIYSNNRIEIYMT